MINVLVFAAPGLIRWDELGSASAREAGSDLAFAFGIGRLEALARSAFGKTFVMTINRLIVSLNPCCLASLLPLLHWRRPSTSLPLR